MKKFTKYFILGAVTLLPFGLTAFVLISFLKWVEDLTKQVFLVVASEFYFPGFGLICGIALVCFLGFLTTMPFMGKVIQAIELPFKNVPILKSVYTAVKSLSDYFSPDGNHSDQQVVIVKLPGTDAEVVGFITRQNLNDLPNEFTKENRIAVFLPLSYQVGGLTVFVPRDRVRKVNMKVEVAMRSALTAWMPGHDRKLENGGSSGEEG